MLTVLGISPTIKLLYLLFSIYETDISKFHTFLHNIELNSNNYNFHQYDVNMNAVHYLNDCDITNWA